MELTRLLKCKKYYIMVIWKLDAAQDIAGVDISATDTHTWFEKKGTKVLTKAELHELTEMLPEIKLMEFATLFQNVPTVDPSSITFEVTECFLVLKN